MITVVSQLSQSQNTQSVTADQRQSSAGKTLPGSFRLPPPSRVHIHVAKGRLGFVPLVT